MTRKAIRDSHSAEDIKPRIMDYVRDDNGREFLEVKDGKVKKTILLDDFKNQLNEYRKRA